MSRNDWNFINAILVFVIFSQAGRLGTNREGYRDARELETPDWTGDDAYPVKYPNGSGGEDDAHRGGR